MNFNDLQIKHDIKKNNKNTMEKVIEKYSKQVYFLAYNIMHINSTKEDIEECVSDVFYQVWKDIDKFNPKRGPFKTWLLILTKYQALTYKRKNSTSQKVISIEDVVIEQKDSIENYLINRENQLKVMDIINNFSSVDKELFIRRYFYNEEIQNIAKGLNLTRTAIDNRLWRGRKRIKEVLDNE